MVVQAYVRAPRPRCGQEVEEPTTTILQSNANKNNNQVAFFAGLGPKLMIDCDLEGASEHQSQPQGFPQDNCE